MVLQMSFARLEIPLPILIACAGLIVLFFWFLLRMLLECRTAIRSTRRLEVECRRAGMTIAEFDRNLAAASAHRSKPERKNDEA